MLISPIKATALVKYASSILNIVTSLHRYVCVSSVFTSLYTAGNIQTSLLLHGHQHNVGMSYITLVEFREVKDCTCHVYSSDCCSWPSHIKYEVGVLICSSIPCLQLNIVRYATLCCLFWMKRMYYMYLAYCDELDCTYPISAGCGRSGPMVSLHSVIFIIPALHHSTCKEQKPLAC